MTGLTEIKANLASQQSWSWGLAELGNTSLATPWLFARQPQPFIKENNGGNGKQSMPLVNYGSKNIKLFEDLIRPVYVTIRHSEHS